MLLFSLEPYIDLIVMLFDSCSEWDKEGSNLFSEISCKMKDSGMEQKTSRTSLLNLMLLKAWRERWSDSQWGINIKTVLPRGVSGDVYNLADCILQQAMIGSNANELVLSYLRHSLCAHLISYAAVLSRISAYENFDKVFCVTALLEFLESIIEGVTCRSKPEENVLSNALVSLVYWLFRIISYALESYEVNGQLSADQHAMVDKTTEVIEKITKNEFLLGVLYIGRQEDTEFYSKITNKFSDIKNSFISTGFVPKRNTLEENLQLVAYIDVNNLEMVRLDCKEVESICYCIQPLLVVDVQLNPSSDTQVYVAEMLMVQRLKKYSMARLYYEIIRGGFISLSNAYESAHDTLWNAFMFIKVPHILKQLSILNPSHNENLDHVPDVVEAIEILMEDTSILDLMDTKIVCNTIEYLLNDCAKQHLVNERHIKHFASKRESISPLPQKREVNNLARMTRAETALSGILKILKDSDYNKVQEALSGVLCQVLLASSFEILLSLATVEGHLKTFVSRLIKWNENSKQVPGEGGKAAMVRSTLFDNTFLMLTFIVQTYGSDVVLSEHGDSFFEKWVRECMVERNKPKSPKNMVQLCDENIVDELLLSLSKPEAQLKNSTLTWQDICMNIPGVLYQILVAWENDTLSSADVKGILDRIKMRLFSFSVCAASYLCAYMQTVKEDEILKPLNMVQQFLSTLSAEEMSSQENINERLGLTFQIIRRMQHDIHPAGNAKIRTMNLNQSIVAHSPLEEQFREVWKTISDRGWLPIKAAQALECLLQTCGSGWLVNKLVKEILCCKYTSDMKKIMDIVFAVMHLDIEKNTIALLDNTLPMLLFNKQQKYLTEPQSQILAKLCVHCIISNVSNMESANILSKKRTRTADPDNVDGICGGPQKLRKLNAEGSVDSCSNDFTSESLISKEATNPLKEPLQGSLQGLFKTFAYFVVTDELSPRIYFIFQFVSLLIECGGDKVRPILKLIPNNLIQNLLKVMITDEITVGLICRLYDLRSVQGRQSAISDLCLLRNIRLRKKSIKL